MISSAYRSVSEQSALLKSYTATLGATTAHEYVARPGTSEHHTGLAVDVDDANAACQADAGRCAISPETAAWLATHAPAYGFIIRYPEGKKAVTGIAYEPWHLRYVGPAASTLTEAGLTLDEFVRKVDPASLK